MIINLEKVDRAGPHRMTSITVGLATLLNILGEPNIDDDPDKVSHSWGVELDGDYVGVWSYKGSEQDDSFSVYYEGNGLETLRNLLFSPSQITVHILE